MNLKNAEGWKIRQENVGQEDGALYFPVLHFPVLKFILEAEPETDV
jgi:hypothetical protein